MILEAALKNILIETVIFYRQSGRRRFPVDDQLMTLENPPLMVSRRYLGNASVCFI